MPLWTRSARFRLAITYSAIVFAVATVVLGAVYFAVQQELSGETVSRDLQVTTFTNLPGPLIGVREQIVRQTFVPFENLINSRTLDRLQSASMLALAGLFPLLVFIGWVIAGRVLRPIGRITRVANEIQATDLSRRIELVGPDDELKQLADTFDGMLDRLESASESQRAFIHETSHELRNPLAIMATNLDVAIAEDSHEDLRQAAHVVRSSVDRIAHTVDGLLAFARREAPAVRFAPLVICEMIDETVAEFAVPAERRGISLKVDCVSDVTVIGDRPALRQVIENLLSNAVRFSGSGSQVRIGGGQKDGWVWLAVADDGPGIAREHHELVWQRYWRPDVADDTDRPRRGLGLAVVRQVAEAHGGTVRLTSSLGAGATFVVWIPQSREVGDRPPRFVPFKE
jgi:signal transduction histidine kinase